MGCVSASQAAKEGRGDLRGAQEFHKTYTLGKKLGEGSFGQVRSVLHRKSSETRAVKILSLVNDKGDLDQRLVRNALKEARVWRHIGRHEHCVELLEAFGDKSMVYLVMEKCGKSLMDELQEVPRMCETVVSRVFREMLLGLRHLHSMKVVHRDVKPNNFLFDANGMAKLCDFGMAHQLPRPPRQLHGTYGTAPYMSPEMVRASGHDISTDIWSFGATAYVLLYGDFPYRPEHANAKAMKAMVLRGHPAPTFERSSSGEKLQPPSEAAEAFVRELLQREAGKRPSADEALALPFLRMQTTQSLDSVEETVAGPEASPSSMKKSISDRALALSKALSYRSRRSRVDEEHGLMSVLRNASKMTLQYEPPVDPIVQRTLDQVLDRLQGQELLHFSEPLMESPTAGAVAEEEAICSPVERIKSKRSTHSGVMRSAWASPKSDTRGEGPLEPIQTGELVGARLAPVQLQRGMV